MTNDWKAILIVLVVLLGFGLLNATTQRISIWIAAIIAVVIVLKKGIPT
jgi:hypothetical protein